MKVLLVADSDEAIKTLSAFFEKRHFDIITYRWLLKALDNVEEVSPQVVVVSSVDYPRQWKTFIQYVHGTLDEKTQPVILLLVNSDFPDSERDKAGCLGVKGIIKGLTEESLEKVAGLLPRTAKLDSIPNKVEPISIKPEPIAIKTEPIPAKPKSVTTPIVPSVLTEFFFTHPKNQNLITGKVISYKKPILHFKPDNPQSMVGLRLGQIIPDVTLKTTNGVSTVKIQIQSTVLPIIQLCIIK